MDDQRFDDSIKNKVGDYEYPGFDPTALATLHHQLGAVSSIPWYSLYRTELLVGSGIALSTLIIILSQWFMSNNTTEILNEKIIALNTQQQEISKLQSEISFLKSTSPDTIRIIEIREQPSSTYTSLLYRIKLLEREAARKEIIVLDSGSESTPVVNDNFEYFKFNGNQVNPLVSVYQRSFSKRLIPREFDRESFHAVPDNSTFDAQYNAKKLSANTIRDLEKHYQQGIGIRIGPTVELAKGYYSEGKQGSIALTYGMLGDFILSPSFSIETGIKYSKRYYDISDNAVLMKLPLPDVDESLGTLQSAEIDSWMFELPIALKYRYPFSLTAHLLGSVGYSSLMYRHQIFEYSYAYPLAGDTFTLGSEYESNTASFYAGSFNITLGVSKRLKNSEILETSIFYQHGLGEKGIERINANFLGVRGVYWFTLR